MSRCPLPWTRHIAPPWPRRTAIRWHSPLLPSRRHSSTYAHLHDELASRILPLLFDHLSPTHSHLLNIALADHLPTPPTSRSLQTLKPTSSYLLPPAHHLLYFPPPIRSALLLPDGTDPLQSPGAPFPRRMWAGGSVRFNNSPRAHAQLALASQRAVCAERITSVAVKGDAGAEKVFVGVERCVGLCREGERESESEASIRARLAGHAAAAEAPDGALLVETRTIVFLRARSEQELAAARAMAAAETEAAAAGEQRRLSPKRGMSHPPDFEHTLVPDARLLFRYSALTYNAHAIHLDPGYCREVEGHRGMLVHGPLSFTLLLTVLRLYLFQTGLTAGQLRGGHEVVREVEYRSLAPLYCGEPLRLCGRRVEDGKYEIWAETPEGGLAVRGIAKTEIVPLLDGAEGPEDMFEDLALNLAGGV